MKINLRN